MAYTPNTWQNRGGVGLNRWRDQDNNLLVLTSDPISVDPIGTPFSADWMNHIETGIKEVHDYFDQNIGVIGDTTIMRFDFEGPGEGMRLWSKNTDGQRISLITAYPGGVTDESTMYSSLFLFDGYDRQAIVLQAHTGVQNGMSISDGNGPRVSIRHRAAMNIGEIALCNEYSSNPVLGFLPLIAMTENANGGELRIATHECVQKLSMFLDVDGRAEMNVADINTTTSSANVVFIPDGSGGYLMRRSTSLRMYKRDIEDIGNAGAAVDALRAVRYKPLDADAEQIGLIAEEVEAAFPALATYGAHGELSGVNYDRVGVLLLAEVQRLRQRVAALEV